MSRFRFYPTLGHALHTHSAGLQNRAKLCIHADKAHQPLQTQNLYYSTFYAFVSKPQYWLIKERMWEFPLWLSGLRTWVVSMRKQVRSLASLSVLRIQCCCELWCRSQMQFRSQIGFDPCLGTSISCGQGPEKTTKTKRERWETRQCLKHPRKSFRRQPGIKPLRTQTWRQYDPQFYCSSAS